MNGSDYSVEHKVPTYEIRQLTNQDPWFYEVLGPFLSRREIVAELGSPVWDDDGKEWTVAFSVEGGVLGFVGIKGATVCSLYVTPQSRGKSVGYALLHNALNVFDASQILTARATDASVEMFRNYGFKEIRMSGRYHVMERPARRA